MVSIKATMKRRSFASSGFSEISFSEPSILNMIGDLSNRANDSPQCVNNEALQIFSFRLLPRSQRHLGKR